jgi:hypothetical protein
MRTTLQLLTIVAESILEQRLTDEIERCGATGWTLSPARGRGSRGMRASEWEGGNVRIEVLATDEVVDRLLSALEAQYFAHYAVVAFVHPVAVLRGEKFGVPVTE